MLSFNYKDIIALIIFFLIFIPVFSLSKIINILFPEKIELSRKTAHFLSGMISLFLPFYIRDIKLITIMCLLILIFLIIMKKLHRMQEIHEIERKSIGAFLFPVAILIIYILSYNKIHLYFISILILTISDTLAALIGGKYGSIPIDVEGNIKSVEGSITFFIITFICIEISLLLMTDMNKLHVILISFIVAVIVTGFELISLWGSDNIFIPLGTFYILNRISQYPVTISIATILQLFISIAIVFLIYRKMKYIKTSWKIAIILFVFGSFALCEYWWALSTIIFCILIMVILRLLIKEENTDNIDVKFALRIGITPTLFIFISATINNYFLLYPVFLIILSSEIILLAYESIANNDNFNKQNIKNKILNITLFIFLLSSITVIPVIIFYDQFEVFTLIFITTTGIIFNILLYFLLNILFNKINYLKKYFNTKLTALLIGSLLISLIIIFKII